MTQTGKTYSHNCQNCGGKYQARYTPAAVTKGQVRPFCYKAECSKAATDLHNAERADRIAESATNRAPRAARRETFAGDFGMVGVALYGRKTAAGRK